MKTETVIAANRFGLGARPGDLISIDQDPRRWLLDQLQGPSRVASEILALPSSAAALVDVQEVREMRRDARQSAAADNEEPAADIVQQYGKTVRQYYLQQTEARYQVAAGTDYPFHERLVHFWSNHFAVSADKQPLPAIAGLFENEAIRPNIAGKFADLLLAVESHPAMILYLDNQRSIGPDSALAKRASRRRPDQKIGLNENLAREILELHTVGVDGGYTQADVTSFARIITGWSVGGGPEGRLREGTPGRFEFRETIHQPGSQVVMGQRYQQTGMEQGKAVLRDLASHPSTAQFIAGKLARHFISDNPPASAIENIARVYRETGGDLPSVHRALVESDAAWQHTHAKYKTPHDFVVSALRAFNRVPENGRLVVGALDLMGQTPYRPGSPAGWPDTAEAWGGADALYKRIEWAHSVGRLAGPQSKPDELAQSVLGPTIGNHTRDAISRAESAQQGLTLFLVSPEFQRR